MTSGEEPRAPGTENVAATPAQPRVPDASHDAAVQTAETPRIPLPPMPVRSPAPPEALLRRIHVLESALAALLLGFAFLVASFRAGNSDLFLHLATGRMIAQGAFDFGNDPFTFTAQGVWVNHNWLCDLVAYWLYQMGGAGGIVLVVCKALLVTGLAWMMFRAGSMPGRPWWVPASCALLGFLAASTRFTLHPLVLSCFLLGTTMLLLFRVGPSSRAVWLLPILCAVWVNLDEWFFLGPLTIGLFLLGEWLQQRTAAAVESSSLSNPGPGPARQSGGLSAQPLSHPRLHIASPARSGPLPG